MGSSTLYQVSLVAAFIAGMVALFAPCCISYLLPAYFGNVFREKKRVVFMTLVYSVGIFVVMMPVVLGAKALSILFFRLHDQVYVIGGGFMLVVAGMSFLGIKLPMPHLSQKGKSENDVVSTFVLGVFSGITSSCCAPVLVGVITLSALSPTVWQSLGVGFAYVLGMVAPLYVASAFIDKRNILEKPILRRNLGVVRIWGREYGILVSNVVAAAIFAGTGGLILVLANLGMLGMPTGESPIVKTINQVAFGVDGWVKRVPGVNLGFAAVAAYLLYRLVKRATGGGRGRNR